MSATLPLPISFAFLLIFTEVLWAQEPKPAEVPKRPIAEWIKDLTNYDNDPVKAAAARDALGPDGPFGKSAVSALIDALDLEHRNRSYVAETIASYGRSVLPDLIRTLKRKEVLVRAGAVEALGSLPGRPSEAVMPLIVALADDSPIVRGIAASNLGSIHRSPDKSVPPLIETLKDKDPDVRSEAAYALSSFGAKAEPAVPGLIALLIKQQDISGAVTALSSIGPGAKLAVPALLKVLQLPNGRFRVDVAEALGNIGPASNAAVPLLVEALPKSEERFQSAIARSLGQIGPDAKAAVPELIKLAKKGSESAMAALGQIGPAAKDAVPILTAELKAPGFKYTTMLSTAAKALGGIGPDAKEAVPALIAVARDPEKSEWVREVAAHAVIKIDPVLAVKERMETAHLSVRLAKTATIKLKPRTPTIDEQKNRIKQLIARLAEIDGLDLRDRKTPAGLIFAPLPHRPRENAKDGPPDDAPKGSEVFQTLVEAGPMSLPFLVEAIGDKTPTKITVDIPVAYITIHDSSLRGNPLGQLERTVIAKGTKWDSDDDEEFGPYTMKIGDFCFLAIGQIVGRDYIAVRYQPTGMQAISSAPGNRNLRESVQAIWSSKEPAQRLFESLLLDYSTEGIFNGHSLDGWSDGSNFQIEATIRLLYYFPKEAAPLIAARLKSLDVMKPAKDGKGDGHMLREVKNGVRTRDFIDAVRWCQEPDVKEALADIANRTDDPTIRAMLTDRPK
jgi:HEAT repeat protein